MASDEPTNERQPKVLSGHVKWFDTEKGYGFIRSGDVDKDVLLHRHVLDAFGRTSIADGCRLSFHAARTDNGFRVVEILSIAPPAETHVQGLELDRVHNERVPARVKWFDSGKGYGFVNQFGLKGDIFVGLNVLRASSFQSLEPGEAVCIQVGEREHKRVVYQLHPWPFEPV